MNFYHLGMKALQAEHGSTAIANRLEETRLRTSFNGTDVALIESSAIFFLATSDRDGHPDCSIKGGDPGFVRVIGDELVFPDYDGNGMFRSLGNISINSSVALLFVNFGSPGAKLRVHGTAKILAPDEIPGEFPGAQSLVAVTPTAIFPNCPRYLPVMQIAETSIYNPRPQYEPPEPAWKSKPDLKDYVPKKHKGEHHEPLCTNESPDK